MSDELYDAVFRSIEISEKYSTRQAFAQNYFYNELPPRLKHKFVDAVLGDTVNRIKFFFNDLNDVNDCPRSFIVRIVTELDMELFHPDETIIEPGQVIKYLRFVSQGSCMIYGKDNVMDKNEFFVCKLPQGSWFGDYQILLNLKCQWRLVAHMKKAKQVYDTNADKYMIQMLTLKDKTFLKILQEYPELRRNILKRATVRRAHFIRIFKEVKHIYLLNKKMTV